VGTAEQLPQQRTPLDRAGVRAMSTATLSLSDASDISISTVAHRKTWESLFALAPSPNVSQAWSHGEGKRAEGWQVERLQFDDHAGTAAICQLLVKRPLGLPVTRIDGGPLFLRERPTPELQFAVLRALRRRWRFGLHGLLLLAPALYAGQDSNQLLRRAGFLPRRDFGRACCRLDLGLPLEELHRRLTPEWRNKIRRAERLGVRLRVRRDEAAIDWLLERHQSLHREDVAGPGPEFVRAMYRAAPGDFWLLQAMVRGQPEAGMLVGRFGKHAENLIAWFSEKSRSLAAGHFLLWNGVIETQRAGCRSLDLGGPCLFESHGHLERGMRGQAYQMCGEWLAF
jgi:hypothetical protein